MAKCIECDADIELDPKNLDRGEILSCPDCGTELEVINQNPIEFDYAPKEEEDWGE